MKLWIKFIIGSVVGIVLGSLLPSDSPALFTINAIIIMAGRYALLPLILFSVAVAAYELKEDKQLLAVLWRSIVAILITTVALAIIGIISAIIADIPKLDDTRVPATVKGAIAGSVDLERDFRSLFPSDLFSMFSGGGDFLLPILILGLLFGYLLSHDKAIGRPLLPIFDSLSRIFYHLCTIFSEFLGFGIIVLAASSFIRFDVAASIGIYGPFIILLSVDTLFVLLIAYPAAIYFLCGRKNPYKAIYSQIGPVIAAFFSGDVNFSLGMQIRHAKESLGIRRRVSSLSMPLFSIFCRGGTALVCAVSLVLLEKTSSQMGISLVEIFWIVGASALVSLALGALPGTGSMAALAVLCASATLLDKSLWILQPASYIIIAFATLLDTVSGSLGSLIVAHKMGMRNEKEARYFI